MLTEIQNKLHYQFKDQQILERALCHKSYANEIRRKTNQPIVQINNERLEFLGDAVLQLVISDLLWDKYPMVCEGTLSKMRSSLVNETRLATIANSMNLGGYLKLGKGELNTGGRSKPSILSAAYEAVLGAIYIDGGLKAAFDTVQIHFKDLLEEVNNQAFSRDYKTRLQEWVQATFRRSPRYAIHKESGPDHEKIFESMVTVGSFSQSGQGRSKKEAEQSAARALLEELIKEHTKNNENV